MSNLDSSPLSLLSHLFWNRVRGVARSRLRSPAILRRFSTAPVDYCDASQSLDAIAHPSEAPFLIGLRIENPRHLSRRRKEILVNECVVIGEKDAKSGMRVIPPHDSLVGILLVLYCINMFPGILGESYVSPSLIGVLALNAGGDLDAVISILTDEYTADLGLAA